MGTRGPRRPCPALIQPPPAACATCRALFAGTVAPVRAAAGHGLSLFFWQARPVCVARSSARPAAATRARAGPQPRLSGVWSLRAGAVCNFCKHTSFLTLCPKAKLTHAQTWLAHSCRGQVSSPGCCVDFTMHGLRLSCSDLPSSSAVRAGATAGAVGVSAHGSSCGTTPMSSGPSTSTSTPSMTPTEETPTCASAFRGR